MHNRIFNQLLSLYVMGAFSYLNISAIEPPKDLRAQAYRSLSLCQFLLAGKALISS